MITEFHDRRSSMIFDIMLVIMAYGLILFLFWVSYQKSLETSHRQDLAMVALVQNRIYWIPTRKEREKITEVPPGTQVLKYEGWQVADSIDPDCIYRIPR